MQLFADQDLAPPEEPSTCSEDMTRIVEVLRTVRIAVAGLEEWQIHDALAAALVAAQIPHYREFSFASGCRADLWIDGIVIEVKKQRPARAALLSQITRYAGKPGVRGVIVVLERSIHVPAVIEGKPVRMLSLNAAWGIAL
ncbi:hypothetical protein [Pseudomonas aeruginosa]|uniref:hypothetical protein n=1 Tax=Pseudomonas aeruginosa TaxID=287 RepID=UPI00287F8C4A|nr:hypothetical protein [Pseudomonas aeruginosa]